MKELKEEINSAYKLLSTLQVSGDVVDVVAAVRAKLRRAYSLAEGKEKEAPNG